LESVLTVRLDAYAKEQGTLVMRRLGVSPSSAVRALFDYAIKNDRLPFSDFAEPTAADVARRVQAFDHCHTKKPLALTDEELREQRLKERYGSDA